MDIRGGRHVIYSSGDSLLAHLFPRLRPYGVGEVIFPHSTVPLQRIGVPARTGHRNGARSRSGLSGSPLRDLQMATEPFPLCGPFAGDPISSARPTHVVWWRSRSTPAGTRIFWTDFVRGFKRDGSRSNRLRTRGAVDARAPLPW
jgi:hypothetical protein